ncbi:hypothetical protein WKH56_20090 [Priestia sp. SB1]|uniref:hypothetical protein n=1 Tax=Priestia sp. SB1 TaxID=3132359 RepID=UPI00316BC982
MKVKKTLHEIYMEITELRRMRDQTGSLVTRALIEKNEKSVNHFSDEYKHFDEVLKYLSQIEVEYEDKYETDEEDED